MSKYKFSQIQDFVFKHTDVQFFDADLALFEKHIPNSPLLVSLKKPYAPSKKILDERMIFDLLTHTNVCIDQVWEARGIIVDGNKLIILKYYLKELVEKNYLKLLEWAKLLNQEQTEESKAQINEIRVNLPKILLDHVYKTNMMPGLQKHLKSQEEQENAKSDENVTDPDESVTDPAESFTKIPESVANTDLKAEAESNLLTADLASLSYNQKKRLIFALKLDIDLPDQKADTLQGILTAYKSTLETKKKEVQG
jgi:hypothetical protein